MRGFVSSSVQDENIENWEIRRTVDGNDRDPYVLDSKFKSIRPGAKITVNIRRLFFVGLLSLFVQPEMLQTRTGPTNQSVWRQ